MADDDEQTGFETAGELRREDAYQDIAPEHRAERDEISRVEEVDADLQRSLGRRRTMLVVGAAALLVLLLIVVYFLVQ